MAGSRAAAGAGRPGTSGSAEPHREPAVRNLPAKPHREPAVRNRPAKPHREPAVRNRPASRPPAYGSWLWIQASSAGPLSALTITA